MILLKMEKYEIKNWILKEGLKQSLYWGVNKNTVITFYGSLYQFSATLCFARAELTQLSLLLPHLSSIVAITVDFAPLKFQFFSHTENVLFAKYTGGIVSTWYLKEIYSFTVPISL